MALRQKDRPVSTTCGKAPHGDGQARINKKADAAAARRQQGSSGGGGNR